MKCEKLTLPSSSFHNYNYFYSMLFTWDHWNFVWQFSLLTFSLCALTHYTIKITA